MTLHNTFIQTTLTTVKPNFRVKQIIFRNPTPFPFYINLSGNPPNSIQYNYLIQPNTNWVSPPLDADVITVTTPNVTPSIGLGEILLYDTLESQPAIMSYFTPQIVGGFPGYPVIVPSGVISFAGTAVLIDKFQTLFFSLNSLINVSISNPVFLIRNSTKNYFFGAFSQSGGITSFTPPEIPLSIVPELSMPTITTQAYSLNVFQSPDYIEDFLPPELGDNGAAALTTVSSYFVGKSPGGIFNLVIPPTTPIAYNITYNLYFRNPLTGDNTRLRSGTFTGTNSSTLNTVIVPPNIVLLNAFGYIRLELINNHATNSVGIISSFYPLLT